MKSLCTPGLILFVSLGWAASSANAQSGAYGSPSLLPLPSTMPLPASTTPASYSYYNENDNPGANNLRVQPQDGTQVPNAAPQSDFDQALHSGDGGCDSCDACNSCCRQGGWFASGAALIMGRNRANPYWTTYQTNNNPNQLLNTQNAKADWAGGGQLTVGYRWCDCNGPALAFTYWQLGAMRGFANEVDQTGNSNTALSTPINTDNVSINGQTAGSYFDNASEHRIWRTDRFLNLELNLLQYNVMNTGRLQMVALAGFRYFRFAEDLTFGSVAFGSTFGSNNGADEAYLGFRCTNNLFGGQIGTILNYSVTDRFGIYMTPKVGIFGNQMNCQTLLYSGNTINAPTYNIGAQKSDVSFLGEVDTGFSYLVRNNIRVFMGYRVVGLANVALADNQFLPYLADTAGFAQVKQNGSILLHGVTTGLAWNF